MTDTQRVWEPVVPQVWEEPEIVADGPFLETWRGDVLDPVEVQTEPDRRCACNQAVVCLGWDCRYGSPQ